ncbi:MAG: hypothetical protein LJE70_13350 [Chromatiaceae bacterium]|jgi:hypothetical protein|nr:hypothetical protein [Chromatiaceae bacterium]
MPKATSPVRLQEDLMRSAALTGMRFHRSAAEQVEYWADIGRRVADVLDPDTLLSVTTGLARLCVEPVVGPVLDPDQVFQNLEAERGRGALPDAVTGSTLRYQSSQTRPGYLERIDSEGQIRIGQFVDGRFIPVDETDS